MPCKLRESLLPHKNRRAQHMDKTLLCAKSVHYVCTSLSPLYPRISVKWQMHGLSFPPIVKAGILAMVKVVLHYNTE